MDVVSPAYLTSRISVTLLRLPEIEMWPTHAPMDGYICESLTGPKGTASNILSKYFEKPVHLLYKGRKPRRIDPTVAFPELEATAKYQDMYPLLVLSEESTVSVDSELRKHVGSQGINEKWSVDNVPIERCVGALTIAIIAPLSIFTSTWVSPYINSFARTRRQLMNMPLLGSDPTLSSVEAARSRRTTGKK